MTSNTNFRRDDKRNTVIRLNIWIKWDEAVSSKSKNKIFFSDSKVIFITDIKLALKTITVLESQIML